MGKMRKKKVTISDIAAKTGYSKTTVSFAFNWPNRISREAVERIMECAQELGYRVTPDSGSDPENRYKNICLFIPDEIGIPSLPIWAKPALEVYKLSVSKGYMLSLISEKRMSDVYFAKTSAVDAFAIFSPVEVDDVFMATAKKRKIPVIGINLDVNGENEEDIERKRILNTNACINLVFNIVDGIDVDIRSLEGAYGFISMND